MVHNPHATGFHDCYRLPALALPFRCEQRRHLPTITFLNLSIRSKRMMMPPPRTVQRLRQRTKNFGIWLSARVIAGSSSRQLKVCSSLTALTMLHP